MPNVRRDPAWTSTPGDKLRALDLAEAHADQDAARVDEIIADVVLGRDPLARAMHLLRYYVTLSPEADAEFLDICGCGLKPTRSTPSSSRTDDVLYGSGDNGDRSIPVAGRSHSPIPNGDQ